MKDPNIKTKVIHSLTKASWNVIGTQIEGKFKFKIARIPYNVNGFDDKVDELNRKEAFEHAEFISYCFNNSNKILNQ